MIMRGSIRCRIEYLARASPARCSGSGAALIARRIVLGEAHGPFSGAFRAAGGFPVAATAARRSLGPLRAVLRLAARRLGTSIG
jgi:hypothetical protein